MSAFIPALDWGRAYSLAQFSNDSLAAVIVTVMLIPQSLAYALLAGLPAQVGLYASILPLIAYGLFGTSRTLAVGPVSVISLMTASALAPLGLQTVADYTIAAAALALVSGVMLLAMGILRLGALANLLSHPVIAGFITATGVLIAAGQIKHILGVDAPGQTLPEILGTLLIALGQINLPTLIIGGAALGFLYWARTGMKALLIRMGIKGDLAGTLAKVGPIFAVVGTTLAAFVFNLPEHGVAVVGDIPKGLPKLSVPRFDLELLSALMLPALLISIIGYVESVSVAQTLAAKKRQKVEPNQELVALGASNIASGVSGGYPVTGGFARSVVNFDAGAETPAAGVFTAFGLMLAALFLTPLLYFLPKATLAATIIMAVLSLVDFRILTRAWGYSKTDFVAVLATIVVTLGWGIETGVASGVAVSVMLFIWKTTRPHVAEVGQVPGCEHFRNINRHKVITDPNLVTLRIDESLYFANARRMEDMVLARVFQEPRPKHVVLMCSAVNEIDLSALESLEALNARLKDLGIALHLSEVKGPVMDRLKTTHFLDDLSGQVFLSQFDAFAQLKGG